MITIGVVQVEARAGREVAEIKYKCKSIFPVVGVEFNFEAAPDTNAKIKADGLYLVAGEFEWGTGKDAQTGRPFEWAKMRKGRAVAVSYASMEAAFKLITDVLDRLFGVGGK